jgi:urease accessory protein UreE
LTLFQAFRSLPIAREALPRNALPDRVHTFTRDTITLGWEERLKTRARRVSDGGIEFGTALARGTTVRQDDCFVLEELRVVVSVVERAEAVFVVTPRSPEQWGVFAYQIGNNHLPLMIDGGSIICPDVPGMEQVLALHQIEFSRATRPFTPLAGLADHRHA